MDRVDSSIGRLLSVVHGVADDKAWANAVARTVREKARC